MLCEQADREALQLVTTEKDLVRMQGDARLAALAARARALPVTLTLADPAAPPPARLAAIDGLVALGVDPARWWYQRDWTDTGRPLHEALGLPVHPLTFVVSLRLGEPASLAPIESRLARYPTLRFKLDATSSWTPELTAALVKTGAVDSIDFKALYQGTVVDVQPDPDLYERVVKATGSTIE